MRKIKNYLEHKNLPPSKVEGKRFVTYYKADLFCEDTTQPVLIREHINLLNETPTFRYVSVGAYSVEFPSSLDDFEPLNRNTHSLIIDNDDANFYALKLFISLKAGKRVLEISVTNLSDQPHKIMDGTITVEIGKYE